MLSNIRIANLRLFEHLEVKDLGRLNLLTGRNNAGKTTFLEALFLLCGAGHPGNVRKLNESRVIPAAGNPDLVYQWTWKPWFCEFDVDRAVQIEAVHDRHGSLRLHLGSDPQARDRVVPTAGNGSPDSGDGQRARDGQSGFAASGERLFEPRTLRVSWWLGKDPPAVIRITPNGLQAPVIRFPFQAVMVSSRLGSPQDDAQRFGELRRRKQGDLLLAALKLLEPRLRGLEVNSATGVPMIWGDVGASELVPLSVMGGGMTRLARLVLAVVQGAGGVVLVDEIENGLHHSAQRDIWRVLDDTCRQFRTQLVATTHSYEAVHEAVEAVGRELLVHRVEHGSTGIQWITYEQETIQAALKHKIEVR